MKPFIFLLFLGIHEVTAVTHSLQYFYTASSGVSNIPEYVSVGMVDGAQISHCDSISNKSVPRQDWMKKVTEEYPRYWDGQTQNCLDHQQTFKENIRIAMQRFNQTGGVHVFQKMYGCEWDDETDETDEVNGYEQLGYDGEDFMAFDLRTESWITPKQEAFISKMKWDHDKAGVKYLKNYLTQQCAEWLKKYVNYGRSSLMRKDLSSVSLLQKTPSSPVSCHATGFYPDRAMMFWRKDGEEIHEGVEQGEILPNHDGSFQMNVSLDVSSVSPEDWRRYDCVFRLSGVEDDIITKLNKTEIRTNWRKNEEGKPPFMIIAIVAAVILVVITVIGFIVYKRKTDKKTDDDFSVGSGDPNAPLFKGSENSSDR